MKSFKVISRLALINGELMCMKPSRRSYQKAHFRQGDLDGACGVYSIAMVLNMIGVFESEELCSDTEFDQRTAEWKLIKALNENGLYRNGLASDDISRILTTTYSKFITVDCIDKKHKLINHIQECLDLDLPLVLGIQFNKSHGHWCVAVGYAVDENGRISHILTLDPGYDTPKCSFWNGIIDLDKEPYKKYGYRYYTANVERIDIEEAIIINHK